MVLVIHPPWSVLVIHDIKDPDAKSQHVRMDAVDTGTVNVIQAQEPDIVIAHLGTEVCHTLLY